MILNEVNFKKIDEACMAIFRRRKQPIMYISGENASKLITSIVESPTSQIHMEYNEGMVGRFYGCIVYVTEEVGDEIVIVPQYQEIKTI